MKNIKKYTFISVTVAFSLLLSGCYTSRPAGRATQPDYNKRVSVSNAHTIKRGNALNVTFNIGLIGAGAVAGYNMPLIQQQTANGKEPVRGANAAIGALAGAGLGYLFDVISGKNKTDYNIDPNKWIKKANPQYKLLSGSGRDFIIIHPSVEQNFAVRNIQDVHDFQKMFPNSSYAEDVNQKALAALNYTDVPELAKNFPQYSAKIQSHYLQQALEQTKTYAEFKERIIAFPSALFDVNVNLNYSSEEQLKTLFAQLDKHSTDFGKVRIRNYKDEILDKLTVIKTDIDGEYETAQYQKVPQNTSDYEQFYKFVARFPNSQYSADLKTRADRMKYTQYAALFEKIQEEAQRVNAGIIENNPVNIATLEGLLNNYEKFSDYDPNNNQREISVVKSIVEQGRSLSAFLDVKNEVNSLLLKIQNGESAYHSTLIEKIKKFDETKSHALSYGYEVFVDDSRKLLTLLEGVNLAVPSSYREVSVGGAVLGVAGMLLSGNVTSLELARPMNTKLAEQHLAQVRIIDLLPYFLEQNRFGEDELLGHSSKLDDKNIWLIIGFKLVDKENQIVTTYNNDANDKISNFLNQWQSNIDGSRSSSSSSSRSSSSNSGESTGTDIDGISIAGVNYSKSGSWTFDKGIVQDEWYKDITFTDGKSGRIRKLDDSSTSYFFNYMGMSQGFYRSEEDVIKALYVYEKYDSDVYKKWRKKYEK